MKKTKKLTATELADQLDILYGNPLGPKQFSLIKDAIDMLRQLDKQSQEK